MSAFARIRDGLVNALTGGGTTVDRRTAAFYALRVMAPQQIDAAYRSSWLMRKVVDRPANDMTRAWRDWQVEGDQIKLIEAEEKRLAVRDKVQRAIILGRLGGGALILGVPQGDTMLPINQRAIGKGALRYIHVLSRWRLSLGQIVTDPEDDLYGQPAYFEMNSATGAKVRLHPSRVIPFKGLPVPDMGVANEQDAFWGDSVVQAIDDAIRNADAAQNGIASLIEEAKVDMLKMAGLNDEVGSAEGEKRVMARLNLAQTAKSIHRALILDAGDDWEQRQITFAGMPDVLRMFLSIVAGAADIPATILLGKSPDGMNATGDADFRAYYDSIGSKQENELRPQIERIDEVLLPSALGSKPDDATFTWAPLWQMDEVQTATVMKTKAEAVQIYVNSGLFDDQSLGEAVGNMLTEDGVLPGFDAALAAAPDMSLGGTEPPPAANENTVQQMQQQGAITADQAVKLLTDAEPRSLYVQRKLLNADEVIAWAKGQGFETTLAGADMHVTVAYSRQPLDWMKVGSSWSDDAKGQLEVRPGGARIVERLGDKGAVVLLFASSELCWRHEDIKRAGASFDFAEYQPHVTITYGLPAGVDLAQVEPYRGRLLFGPEIFEELDPDWAESVVEA
jgi:phage-related protein (TIGR01555 family)